MQTENRSIQDMNIYGDLLQIPIIIVEEAMNAPVRAICRNSYISRVDQKDKNSSLQENVLSGSTRRSLNIVVFVHGFQVRPTLPIRKLIHGFLAYHSTINACRLLWFGLRISFA